MPAGAGCRLAAGARPAAEERADGGAEPGRRARCGPMSTAFDTLAAARDMERAGLQRETAEAVASAIRAGQGDLATKTDVAAVRNDIATLRWVFGIHLAISLATLAAVLAMAFGS